MAAKRSSEAVRRWLGAGLFVGALAQACTLTHDTDKFRAADDTSSSAASGGSGGGGDGAGGGGGEGGAATSTTSTAGGAPASSSSGSTPCGNEVGQPCCRQGMVACATSLTCVADVCVSCGDIGEPCCPGFACVEGQCCDPSTPLSCNGRGTTCLDCCAHCKNNGGVHTLPGVGTQGCLAAAQKKCNEDFGNCDPGNPNKKNCCDEQNKCLANWSWTSSCGP